MSLTDDFISILDVWEEARPYISMMASQEEMELVVRLAGSTMDTAGVASLMGIDKSNARKLISKCHKKGILYKTENDDNELYSAAGFEHILDEFVKHGNWDDIPLSDRKAIDKRFLHVFVEKHRHNVERKMKGGGPRHTLPNDAILLLHEAEDMVHAAEVIAVQPCDCRRLGQNCTRPVNSCIWFNDVAQSAIDRGIARAISKENAVDLLRNLDRKGLMHTADAEWRENGLYTLCNCCADDCYPFRAAKELGSKGHWPRSRYIAVIARDRCTRCGLCVNRCHFSAFSLDETSRMKVDGKESEEVCYDPVKCWGCGLCATACPEEAIRMDPLE